MHIEDIRDYVLSLPEVEETTPFGPDVIVYKTKGKMFLLLPIDTEQLQFNVKCDPERAIQLREEYPEAVLPGYHMSKKHWNTLIAGMGLSTQQLIEFINDSYQLIRGKKK
jgi:predicted DNA-binding protein (MmcQ/YjbR family)